MRAPLLRGCCLLAGSTYPAPTKTKVPKKKKGKAGDQLVDVIVGWRVDWDDWNYAAPYWGPEEPPVQPWEIDPLAHGFLGPVLTALAEDELIRWEDAMTRGDTEVLAAPPLHWSPVRGELQYRQRPLWEVPSEGRAMGGRRDLPLQFEE